MIASGSGGFEENPGEDGGGQEEFRAQAGQEFVSGATFDEAIELALGRLAGGQEDDGSWWGDYGGPMFLLPMYIALCHLTGREIEEPDRTGMKNEFLAALQPDGGVGLHREGAPCVFTTTLAYVSLRLLGESADREELISMRDWIEAQGSPHGAAPWGKWVLCLLGLYDYRGIDPIPPELWLLPRWVPVHPARLWCHCRMVYLPMSWLYAKRFQGEETPLIRELRSELFNRDWDRIKFHRYRRRLARTDRLEPPRLAVRIANRILGWFEKYVSDELRERACEEAYRQLSHEDEVTSGIGIGPVNRVLNTLCHFHADPDGEAFARGSDRAAGYLWRKEDRCFFQGYNNSKLWDTAFAIQAAVAAGARERRPVMLRQALGYVERHQVLEDVPDREAHYRDPSRGGWPFSDRDHGWPISDCTAEGLKSVLLLVDAFPEPFFSEDRLHAAVDLLLEMQNPDGGWPTYERRRAGGWLEFLNPSGVFSRIMVDYSYPECTSAVVQALARARTRWPDYRSEELARAIGKGRLYLRGSQRGDGSWEGSWGVCFTYGTWFGVSGLAAAGVEPGDPDLARARDFLLAHQRSDGSWGEEIDSCRERRWIERADGHVVQTSWAILALLRTGLEDTSVIERAARFLVERQSEDGGWPDQGMVGMFNRTCAIHYDWYRLYFPLWALAECRSHGIG